MKNYLPFILFLFLFSGLVGGLPAARASHLLGGDMTYTSLGGNQYRVKFRLDERLLRGSFDRLHNGGGNALANPTPAAGQNKYLVVLVTNEYYHINGIRRIVGRIRHEMARIVPAPPNTVFNAPVVTNQTASAGTVDTRSRERPGSQPPALPAQFKIRTFFEAAF